MNIIFIHKWYSEYVKYALLSAKKYNDDSNIYLITDNIQKSQKDYWLDFVRYINLSDYVDGLEELKSKYIHLSNNIYEFELFCIQRWFIIKNFVEKNNIDIFFHADSDCLIYSNLDEYYKKYLLEYDFCYTAWCGHFMFSNVECINWYCESILSSYSELEKIKYLNEYRKWKYFLEYNFNWAYYRDETKSVTDIVLLDIYIKDSSRKYNFKNLNIIHDNQLFDNNYWVSEWFRTFMTLKSLKFKNWIPYWINNWKEIKFNWIHFQWKNKKFMKYFYEKRMFFWYVIFFPRYIKIISLEIIKFILKKVWVFEVIRNFYIINFIIWRK